MIFFFNLSSVAEGTNPHIAGSLRLPFRYHGGGEGSAQLQTLTSDTLCKKLKKGDLKLGFYIKRKPAPMHIYPTKGFLPLLLFFQVKGKKKAFEDLPFDSCDANSKNRIGGQWVPKGSWKVSPARSLPAFSRTAFNVNDSQRTATQPSTKAVASLSSHSSQEP